MTEKHANHGTKQAGLEPQTIKKDNAVSILGFWILANIPQLYTLKMRNVPGEAGSKKSQWSDSKGKLWDVSSSCRMFTTVFLGFSTECNLHIVQAIKGKHVHQWFEHYTILHRHTLQKGSQGWLDLGNVFVCIAGASCKLNINVRPVVVYWCLCLRLAEEHQKLTQDSGCFRQDIMSLEVIDTQSFWVAGVLQAEPFWV